MTVSIRMNKRLNQINRRLDEPSSPFNQRIDAVNERIDEHGSQINERIDRLPEQMRVQARWTVGTIALFGTIVTVLLAIAEFGA